MHDAIERMLAKYDIPDIIVDTMLNRVDVKIKFDLGKKKGLPGA